MFKKLFTSSKTYIALGVLIALGAGFLLLLNEVIMPAYTNFHEGVTVPDVTKVSLKQAEKRLADYGLRYKVADRRSHAAYPADYVIDQDPAPLEIVKPNRKIYLTVNTAKRPTVIVPDVTNLSLRNAKIQLQNYGLDVGTISYVSSRFKNSVLRQSISSGKQVDKGSIVDLTVSDGLGVKKVAIPDIKGLRLTDAQNKLRDAGLRLGPIRFQPSKEYSPNVVLGYMPAADSLTEGETLSLVVSERYEVKEESERGAVIIDSTDSGTPPDTLQNNQKPEQK